MKYALMSILLITLTACTPAQDMSTEEVKNLEAEVARLTIENANLKEENVFLRA